MAATADNLDQVKMEVSQEEPPSPSSPHNSYQDPEALDLSAALVVRAAEFAATDDRTACQNLAAWLGAADSDGQRTIEVRTTTNGDEKHAALVRWLRAAAVPPFAQGRRIQARFKPPAWRTVAEKKLNLYFDKSREPVKSWGAGDVRKWHLRPALLEFLRDATKDPARIAAAVAAAAPEREASNGLVLLSWPENSAAPAPPNSDGAAAAAAVAAAAAAAAAAATAAPAVHRSPRKGPTAEPEPEPEPQPKLRSPAPLTAGPALEQLAQAVRTALFAGCAAEAIQATVQGALQKQHGHGHGSPVGVALAVACPSGTCPDGHCHGHCPPQRVRTQPHTLAGAANHSLLAWPSTQLTARACVTRRTTVTGTGTGTARH